MSDEDHYVGYRKPPRNNQFPKGKSGNPNGRPKGSVNPATMLVKALRETVVIVENGKKRRITKLQAVMKQAVNKAAVGDPKGTQALITLLRIFEKQIGVVETQPTPVFIEFIEAEDGRPKEGQKRFEDKVFITTEEFQKLNDPS